MKLTKKNFIPYKNYGMTHTTNLVLSFISMYGKTYASNKHISERLDISVSTISRTLKKLEEKGYIKILNPNGRSRFIILNNQPNQNEDNQVNMTKIPNQIEEDNLIKLTNNNKEDKKENNKAYNKAYNKVEEVDEESIFSSSTISKKSSISTERVKEILDDDNDCITQLLSSKGIE